MALDGLDVGVVLVERTEHRILFANPAGQGHLRSFGSPEGVLPEPLWELVAAITEDAAAVPARFTQARPITAPDGQRYFVRGKVAPSPCGTLIVTIAAATLREIDIKRVLAEQFGLSAQEARVAFLASQGYRNREIAVRLDIVEGTVKNYLTQIYETLGVRSRTQLTAELRALLEEQTDVHRRGM